MTVKDVTALKAKRLPKEVEKELMSVPALTREITPEEAQLIRESPALPYSEMRQGPKISKDLEAALEEQAASEQSGHVVAIKELTSEKPEIREHKQLTNMDFKTRLTLQEISAHACLDFLHDVMLESERDRFTKELIITDLVLKMKRLRVSEAGKSREAVEDIFKQPKQDDGNSLMRRFFNPPMGHM